MIQSVHDREALARLIATASTAGRVHAAQSNGMCAGCQADWSRVVPYPCTQAQWARSVLDRYLVGAMSRSLIDQPAQHPLGEPPSPPPGRPGTGEPLLDLPQRHDRPGSSDNPDPRAFGPRFDQ